LEKFDDDNMDTKDNYCLLGKHSHKL